jgi:Calcineurin-like phosphoesterase
MRASQPGRVVVAGDLHGRVPWALHVIDRAAQLLDGEPVKIILQLGDFGIWPGPAGDEYLRLVTEACTARGVLIRFIEGNHDWPAPLPAMRVTQHPRAVSWLPRGCRWEWHGRTWLAMGGATTLDRAGPPCRGCAALSAQARARCSHCGGTGRLGRTEGVNWWPEEEITDVDAAAAIAAGPADVLISHDCPAGVTHSFPGRPWWFYAEIPRAEAHAARLQRIVDGTRPQHVIHGHLHRGYQRPADFGYGPAEITGLDRDREPYNYGTLDVRGMTWDMTP